MLEKSRIKKVIMLKTVKKCITVYLTEPLATKTTKKINWTDDKNNQDSPVRLSVQ